MRKTWKPLLISLLAVFVLPAPSSASDGVAQRFAVTITNITRGQILSPPVVFSHDAGMQLFDLGAPASPELAALAEDADNAGLLALLMASPQVRDVAQGAGPIPPGGSATLEVEATEGQRLISFAAMLVTTNDGFAGLRGLAAHPGRRVMTVVPAYDAGSEANSEMCAFIPGPPCENPHQRDTAGAEGFVHVHAGIQGIADLGAEQDWRNPVARVTITRVANE